MKKITYIFLSCLLLVLTSCTQDVLDKKPLDVISDATVWNDQGLIDAYLTNVYLKMPILTNESPNLDAWDFGSGDMWNGPFIINEITDEAKRNWIFGQANNIKNSGITINGGILEWWERGYASIRMLNEFITRLPDAPVEEAFKKRRLAEARFLRAFNYFAIVKRYGGVPLITVAQDLNTPLEELYPSRNKEQEIYDFVISELEEAVIDLPEKGAAGYEYGRPDKNTALALKSRVALYAGSISQFGTVQLGGIVGIEAAASVYYQKAYDAAKAIIDKGNAGLYNADADKVMNFRNVFLKKQNNEILWAQRHDNADRINSGGNGWVWDFFQCPKPHGWGAGNQNAPYLEMAEEFEYADGTPGALDRDALETGIWSMDDLWGGRDPRFYATIWTQNTPWKGGFVDFHNGLRLPDNTIQTDGSYNGVLAKGDQSVDNSFGTGFGVMKYLDESHSNMGERATSGTDFILIRYAEVLLNFAEAAFELGHTGDALDAINDIRERAGVAALGAVDRNAIRHERKVELAFEGHRYWDVRRWRIAVDELSVNRSGLKYILDYTTGDFKIDVIENIDGANSNPRFLPENYYLPLTVGRTSNNTNLVENPGYQ